MWQYIEIIENNLIKKDNQNESAQMTSKFDLLDLIDSKDKAFLFNINSNTLHKLVEPLSEFSVFKQKIEQVIHHLKGLINLAEIFNTQRLFM